MKMPGITFLLKYAGQFFLFNRDRENVSEYSVMRNYLRKYSLNGKSNAILKKVPSKFLPGLGKNDGKFIPTWNFGANKISEWIEQDAKRFIWIDRVGFLFI
jgi:hypothetical protein